MLKFPHPLFSDNVNFNGAGWWPIHGEQNLDTPRENHHVDQERNDGPGEFQFQRAGFLRRFVCCRTATVFDSVINDQKGDEQSEEDADRDQKEVEMIHLTRIGGSLFRE